MIGSRRCSPWAVLGDEGRQQALGGDADSGRIRFGRGVLDGRGGVAIPHPPPSAGVADAWGGLAVLAILLTPFTTLMYYLAHYRNDSLLAFFLVWAIAGWLRAEWAWNGDPTRGSLVRKLIVLIPPAGCTILVVMIRYNAVVTLPVFLILVALIIGRTSRSITAATAAVLVFSPMILHEGILRMFDVVRSTTGTADHGHRTGRDVRGERRGPVQAPLHFQPPAGGSVPEQVCPRVGLVGPTLRPDWIRITDDAYCGDYKRLSREYRRAIRKAPGTWLTVKAKAAFASLLDQAVLASRGHRPQPLWYHVPGRSSAVRSILLYIDAAIFADPVLRFLCARHLPWVVLNVILVILAAIAAGLTRTRGSVLVAALLLLPLAYYVSHLLAVTAHDYRYMFPATLLLQILVACAASQAAGRWMEVHVARLSHEQLKD